MTFTITQANEAFCEIDKTQDDKRGASDKLLRNLTQRHYFPPVGRSGRADIFDLETVCALRLVQKASYFGLDRWQLEKLAHFLNGAPHTAPGRTKTLIREAVERASSGEVFSLSLVMYSDGRFLPKANWGSKTPEQDARIDAIFDDADVSLGDVDCSFSLNASRLIDDVLGRLPQGES